MKLVVKIVLSLLVANMPISAWSHGGGVDQNGCHRDSSTGGRHCHSSSGTTSGSSSETSEGDAALAVISLLSVIGLILWATSLSSQKSVASTFENQSNEKYEPKVTFTHNSLNLTVHF
jgi:hypothetical protein